MKPEEKIEAYLRKRVKETGGDLRKVQWPGHRGAPDRLCGWPALGRFSFVELKAEGDYGLQPHQCREIDKLKRWGLPVCVAIGKAGVDAFVKEMTGR